MATESPQHLFLALRKPYYTPSEIANMANVSRQTVVKWIADGRLPADRTRGGHWRIPPHVLRQTGIGIASEQLISVR